MVCAAISFTDSPVIAFQMQTVPSSWIEMIVSSKGPQQALVAFCGSERSMVKISSGSEAFGSEAMVVYCHTQMRSFTSPSDERKRSLHVTTLVCESGFWFHSQYLQM